ncbi:MAG: hypothetical protein ACR2NZ_20765 [Rubripirellula sp.]
MESAIHYPTIQEDRMTVSPQWPDEGNRQPHHDGNGPEADDSHRPNALPPTLFKLPNLNVDQANPTAPTEDGGHSATPEPAISPVVAQMPFVAAGSVTKEQASAYADPEMDARPGNAGAEKAAVEVAQGNQDRSRPHDSDEDSPTFPMPPAVVTKTETPATVARRTDPPRHAPSSSDTPAGRSWMDSIGSHGIVVVLLLVVVAAALITGRRSANSPSNSSVADSTEWLNFDEGSEVELPIPSHVIEPASTSDVTSLVESMGLAKDGEAIAKNMTGDSADSLSNQASLGIPTSASELSPAIPGVDQANQTAVAFDASTEPYTGASAPIWGTESSSNVQINEYVSGPTSIDVMTAANRIPVGEPDASLPSLEELAGEPSADAQHAASGSAIAQPVGNIRVQTSTPTGVVDWSQYLPTQENLSDATLPSSNN